MVDKVNFGEELVTPQEKTRRVGEVFSSVARRYDVMNDLENLMSISVIAPQPSYPPAPPSPHHMIPPSVAKTDVAYIRSMWHLGNLVQETISSPCSLSLPLANSPRHKDSLIAAFKRLYKSFPAHLTNLDYLTLDAQLEFPPNCRAFAEVPEVLQEIRRAVLEAD